MNGAEKFKREIEERSLRRASERGGPGGSMAAGAILGGLVAGPFGALFGANIGANLGVKSSLDKARKEEMERMGITQEMLDAAEDVGQALQQSMQGMDATKESLSTQQALARRIDQEATDLYERAKEAMAAGDEEKARILLLRRTNTQDKLKIVLKGCADEKKRLEIMEQNVTVLQQRAMEVEAMLSRTVGAKARQDSASTVNDFEIFSVRDNDPLLQKFKDLGID
jgi:phage shock protein A